MKYKIRLQTICALFIFSLNGTHLFSQIDSTHRIRIGLSLVPISPVFHTVRDTEIYSHTAYPSGGYGTYLDRISYTKKYNLSTGALLFINLDNYLELNCGILLDLIPYRYASKDGNTITNMVIDNTRIPIDVKFRILKRKKIFVNIIAGGIIRQANPDEGFGHIGLGSSYYISKKISFSANCKVDFINRTITESYSFTQKNKIFVASFLLLSINYSVFCINTKNIKKE